MTASDANWNGRAPTGDDAESPAVGAVDHETVEVGETVSNAGRAVVNGVSAPAEDVTVTELRFRGAVDDSLADAVSTWRSLSSHDYVVGLVDWDGQHRLVTEHMDGGSLGDRLADADDVIWPDEAAWITERLCAAVEHAHDEGTLHTGIHPETVQFRTTEAGSWAFPKLGGWGVTRQVREDPNAVADVDTHYAAPEQVASDGFGDPDERTDVYRLGSVCYALLTGRPPVTGSGYEALRATLAGTELVPPSEETDAVPEQLDDVVLKALSPDPADRYESVAAFREALAAVELPLSATTAATVGEYRQYAGGPANRGLADGSPIDDGEFEELWQTRGDAAVASAPVVAYGTVYVGDDNGTVRALHADAGEKRWAVALTDCADDPDDGFGDPYAVETPPAVGQGVVCVGTDAGLFALDAADGRNRWERDIAVAGAVTVDDGVAYVPARDDTLYALDIETGTTVWDAETDDGFGGEAVAPAVADGLVAVNTGGGVDAVDAATGDHRWTFPTRYARPPSIGADHVYAGDGDTVYAVEAESGRDAWRADIEYEIAGPPAVDGETVYVTVRDDWGGVQAFDPEGGDRRWEYSLEALDRRRQPRANAVVADDAVVLLLESVLASDDETEEVVVVGTDDGRERARHDVSQREHTPPAIVDDRLVCANAEFDVVALAMSAAPEGSVAADEATADTGDEQTADTGEAADIGVDEMRRVCDVLKDQPREELDEDVLPDELGWSDDRTTAVVDEMVARDIVEVDDWDDVVLLDEPDWDGVTDSAAADEGRPKIDWDDAKQVCEVLNAQVNNELDKDWLPDELGWTEGRTRAVVDDLKAHGYVEINDWDEVVLVEEPSRDDGGGTQSSEAGAATTDIEVTSDDAETLLDLIEQQADGRLVRDLVEFETDWSAAKADAVIEDLAAAGQVTTTEMGDTAFVSVDETGVVGGIDTAAGQARPDADALADHMADPDLAAALSAAVQNAQPDGTVELLDAMDDLPDTDQWGLLVANGYLVQSGDAFEVSLPDGVDFEFSG